MKRLLNQGSNLFLLLLGTLCQIALLADSFDCRIDRSLWFWLGICCVLLWIAGSFRKGIWIGMPLSAALLFLAYRFYRGNPLAQMEDLIDHISGAYYTHVIHPGAAYPLADAVPSHSLVLLFIGFLLAAYLITALTSRNLRISLTMLETVPIFISCVVVNGSAPPLASAGLLLFWFLVIATGAGFQPEGNIGRTLICCLVPICLILGGLLTKYNPETYVFTEYDNKLNERFARYSSYFDLLVGNSASGEGLTTNPDQPGAETGPRSSFHSFWNSSDNSMRLSQPFDSSLSDLRVMQVRAETSGRLYLRSQSYGDYNGVGWAPAEELSSGSSLPFTAFAAEYSSAGVKRELEVRTLVDLPALCIPYYAAVSTGSDISVSAADQPNYRVSYMDYHGNPAALSLPENAAAAEQMYRTHAHSVYTRLPDGTLKAAQQICQQAGLYAGDPNVVQNVARYVQNSGEYDLSTGAYPSNDYAIYFLTESHRGYCIHYATAAAVLYRSLGIPARVAEGFAVETHAGSLTSVLAGDSHAWVEVYWDGVGWIPMEVTAQAGIATQNPEPSAAPDASPSPSPVPQNVSSDPEPSEQPVPSPDGNGELPQNIPPERHFPWLVLLILPALALLVLLWYLLVRAVFRSQIQNPDGRRAVVACWKYARRVAAFGGTEIPEDIVNAAEKVAFSLHAIHKEELVRSRAELQALIEQVYPSLRPLAKLRFRFLYGMH